MSLEAGKMNNSRRGLPPITVYMLSNGARPLEMFHCPWCTRPVAPIKGIITKLITTPSGDPFDAAVQPQCSRCKQDYRFVIADYVKVKELYW